MINVKKLSFCIACSAIVSVLSLTNVDARIEFGLGKGKVSLATAMRIAGATLNHAAGGDHFTFGNAMQPGSQITKVSNKSATLVQADIDDARNQMNMINDIWFHHGPALMGINTGDFSIDEILYEMINWPMARVAGEVAHPKINAEVDGQQLTGRIQDVGGTKLTVMCKKAAEIMKTNKIFHQQAEMNTVGEGIRIAREISKVMKTAFRRLKTTLEQAAANNGQINSNDTIARLRAEIAALRVFRVDVRKLEGIDRFVPDRALPHAQGAVRGLRDAAGVEVQGLQIPFGGLERGSHIRQTQGLVDAMRYVFNDLVNVVVGGIIADECRKLLQFIQIQSAGLVGQEGIIGELIATGNELVVELGDSITLLTADIAGNEAMRTHQKSAVGDLHLLDLVRSLEQIRPGNWEDRLKHQLEADEDRAIVTGILNDQLAAQQPAQPVQPQAQAPQPAQVPPPPPLH